MPDESPGSRVYMLTTIDNPWDPFTQYPEWYAFDQSHGYDTPGYLARVCRFSYDLSDADQDDLVEEAIDKIVRDDDFGIYKKAG